jgi:hypothetical protein
MLDDHRHDCPAVGHIKLQIVGKILHSLHFCSILSHLLIIATILFLHLLCYQL